MQTVHCLDDGMSYGFSARTPYEALRSMLYTLNLVKMDTAAKINKTESGEHLWFEHSGKTYSIKN